MTAPPLADAPRVLVVDDEAPMRRFLRASLGAAGYTVEEAATGAEALRTAASHPPDAVLLDLGLPDLDGVEVARRLREWSSVPVVVLSARGREADKIEALDAGADDYVTKPFDVGELMARVRAALRRGSQASDPVPLLRIGEVTVNLATREASSLAGAPVRFTPLEFRVLACLAHNLGMVVTRDQLIREVWGPDRVTDTRGLRSYVKMLRQKLEPDPRRPRHLVTEPGIGYRLVGEA